MSKTIDEILAPKPEARPRIYAYSIADRAHSGLLKVGQTTRDVKQRVASTHECKAGAWICASRVAVRRSDLKVAPHSHRQRAAHA